MLLLLPVFVAAALVVGCWYCQRWCWYCQRPSSLTRILDTLPLLIVFLVVSLLVLLVPCCRMRYCLSVVTNHWLFLATRPSCLGFSTVLLLLFS